MFLCRYSSQPDPSGSLWDGWTGHVTWFHGHDQPIQCHRNIYWTSVCW